MPLNLPDGSACFVDANILYYALVPTPIVSEQCVQLLDRAIGGAVSLSVSVPVLSDALHKVMISEVAQMTGRDRAGMVGYLGRHPEVIKQLVEYPKGISRLLSVPMDVLSLDAGLLTSAAEIAVREGLLTNDSLIVALMKRHGIAHLATNDDDFDDVSGITVWKPR